MATIASVSDGYYLGGNFGWHPEYNHHSRVDGSNTYGNAWGFLRRNVVGGTYTQSTSCGSRALSANINTANILSQASITQGSV